MRSIISLLVVFVVLASCDYKPRNHGRVLYERHCQSCHMEDGVGLRGLFPPVANADYVIDHKEDLACIIRHGMDTPVTVNGKEYSGEMTGNSQLTEVEVSNLVFYILRELNQQDSTFTIEDIRAQLKACDQ